MEILKEIIVALITGGITLIGVILSNSKKQAIIETKMESLEKKVEEHNGYAKMFSENIPVIAERIKVINHRLDDCEKEIIELRRLP